jgi:hypothetical protein
MTTTDVAILEYLSDDPRSIRELVGTCPKATLYARLHVLQTKGLVAKRGSTYFLTTAGLQRKAERQGGAHLQGLNDIYPALRHAPSPQHRAVLELGLAALVRRQHGEQEEHHAGFCLLGPPLTGKSSAGGFVCLAAGADPALCIVDLAAEAGKSLWIRRGAAGGIQSQRSLLGGPVIVLDEYQHADAAVRRAIAPLLSGRYRIPIEDELATLKAVPILTMNPRAGNSLAARTGLSWAQLRRLIPCDLTNVALPDLALTGGEAIAAARRAGPLKLRAPRDSCEEFRGAVVHLLRHVLTPEGLRQVDVELVLGLGAGLTAWLPAAVAMQQVLFDVLLVLETVGWASPVPGWLERVRDFPADKANTTGSNAEGTPPRPGPPPGQTILLYPETAPVTQKEHASMSKAQESMLPSFTISDQTRAEIIWLAQDAGVSLDRALHILVGIYRLQRANQHDLGELETILYVRESCAATGVIVEDLREHLQLHRHLQERGLTLDDLRRTCQVADDLVEAGLYLEEAIAVADLMKALKKAGVDARVPDRLAAALARYTALGYGPTRLRRLAELWERLQKLRISLTQLEAMVGQLQHLQAAGLDPAAAETLATALDLAGVPAAERPPLLREIVEKSLIRGEPAEPNS